MSHNTSTIDKDTTNEEKSTTFPPRKRSDISFSLHFSGFHQDSVSVINDSYFVTLSCTHKRERCPVCGQYSNHVKGHYVRSLQGLEIMGHRLTLIVNVCKFRCMNESCHRKVFSTCLFPLACPRARNTSSVEERIREVSLKTTSRIASNLLSGENIICSGSSCLRRAHVHHEPPRAPVSIGLDDYAQKKGRVYDTVIVDQITHKPIMLLTGRGEENLKEYLERNPQIQYITCDRAQCFTKVINQALPGAARIADRFHLIKDLVDGMTGEIASRSRLGVEKRSFDFPSQETVRKRIMESLYNMGDEKHRSKLRRFIDAEDCMRKGMSLNETARHLNVHSHVICKLMRGHTSRDYMSPQQKSILKHVDQLAFEISHGCAHIKVLKEKMKGMMEGHDVERATLEIRKDIREGRREIKEYNKSVKNRKYKTHASVKAIHELTLNGHPSVDPLKELMKDAAVNTAINLCVEFREMLKGRVQYRLDKWIDRAMESDLKALREFAQGIKRDKQPVQNAIDIYLNNGVLEGTVNKIKMLKRQMFNKADINLMYNKLINFST